MYINNLRKILHKNIQSYVAQYITHNFKIIIKNNKYNIYEELFPIFEIIENSVLKDNLNNYYINNIIKTHSIKKLSTSGTPIHYRPIPGGFYMCLLNSKFTTSIITEKYNVYHQDTEYSFVQIANPKVFKENDIIHQLFNIYEDIITYEMKYYKKDIIT